MCCKHTHLPIGCCFCSLNLQKAWSGLATVWSLLAWYSYGCIGLITLIITIITQCHTHTHILIFTNKDCSFLPNLQCAFCWLSCVLPLSSVCCLWDKPSLHVLSFLPCFYNTLYKWLLIFFGVGQTAYPFTHMHVYTVSTWRYLISEPAFHDLEEIFWTVRLSSV